MLETNRLNKEKREKSESFSTFPLKNKKKLNKLLVTYWKNW